MKNTTIISSLALILAGGAHAEVENMGWGGVGLRDINVAAQSTAGQMIGTPVRMFQNVGDELPPMLSQGTQEFGISGNVNFADDVSYNLNLSYGWFVRDNWEFGFNLGVQGIESDKSFSGGLFTEYNFANGDSKWVPFIGMSANWATLDSDAFNASSIALGLDIGIKYFIRENIALSFSIGADYAFDDVFPGGDDFAEQINIGTRFYF